MMRYMRYMFHYVYRITNGRQYYIGSRSSKKPPEQDNYKGSGMWCICTVAHLPRTKEVIAIFPSRREADAFEHLLLMDHVGRSNCMNRKRTLRSRNHV